MAVKAKKLSIRVPAPKTKASGRLFAHVTEQRQKPLKSRIYTKDVLREDPSEFFGFGFGDTGLTGRT